MKLVSFLFVIVFIQLSANVFGQVTIYEKNVPFAKVFKSIEKQTGYLFIYDEAKVKLGNISLDIKNAPLNKTLDQCFKDVPVTYIIIEKTIVLKPKKQEPHYIDTIKNIQKTFSITGRVTDEKGEILTGAIVFLNNSTIITATNTDGTFKLKGLRPGSYDLVAKMIGFNSSTQNITIHKESVNINVKLTESNTALGEVIIKQRPDQNRARYLKLFIKNFIGTSANSSACKILNPEVIQLHYNSEKGKLEARSDEFIKIENQALGYTVSYLLTYFEFDTKNHSFSYEGKPYFEEVKGTQTQQKKWERNRKKAYEGSIGHFFRALFNNTTEAEGFFIYRLPVKLTRDELLTIRPISSDSLFSVIDNNFKLLKLNPVNEPANSPSKLYVIYTHEDEPGAFFNSDDHIDLPENLLAKRNQVSQLAPIKDGMLLDKNGVRNPANNIMFSGYWVWERVADLMPFDYYADTLKPAAIKSQ